MLLAILAFFYITFICWCYGRILITIVSKAAGEKIPFPVSFFTMCFAGLGVTGILFTIYSLFFPLGNLAAQVVLLAPACCIAFFHRKDLAGMTGKIKPFFLQLSVPSKCVLLSCTLLLFMMHGWVVNHPDTLAYHAQNIQWIEKYRVIPGVANLRSMYGLQSSWFILCALFSFKFTGTAALTFLNVTVLVWYICTVVAETDKQLKQEGRTHLFFAFTGLLILAFSLASYTQARLSVTSASPDFIVAIYLYLIVYLFIRSIGQAGNSIKLLLLFLGCFAITIKLQALPVILLCLIYFYSQQRKRFYKLLFFSFVIMLVTLIPLLARNIISSGYPLFPSTIADFFSFDWKLPRHTMLSEEQYITTYARIRTNIGPANDYLKHSSEWLPVWWKLLSVADKLTLIILSVVFLLSMLRLKKIIRQENKWLIAAALFLTTGVLFWFVKAPDPRFGYGFIIPLLAILLYLGVPRKLWPLTKTPVHMMMILISLAVSVYTVYRVKNYFSISSIYKPQGIEKTAYETIDCHGVQLYIPLNDAFCGSTPVPCTNIDCSKIEPRGKQVESGFRPAARK